MALQKTCTLNEFKKETGNIPFNHQVDLLEKNGNCHTWNCVIPCLNHVCLLTMKTKFTSA